MPDIRTAPTPDGSKFPIAAEELGIPYRIIRLQLSRGDRRRPEFLAINPKGGIPAIVDHDVPGGPVAVFETGAILLQLGQAQGGLIAPGIAGRAAAMDLPGDKVCATIAVAGTRRSPGAATRAATFASAWPASRRSLVRRRMLQVVIPGS